MIDDVVPYQPLIQSISTILSEDKQGLLVFRYVSNKRMWEVGDVIVGMGKSIFPYIAYLFILICLWVPLFCYFLYTLFN